MAPGGSRIAYHCSGEQQLMPLVVSEVCDRERSMAAQGGRLLAGGIVALANARSVGCQCCSCNGWRLRQCGAAGEWEPPRYLCGRTGFGCRFGKRVRWGSGDRTGNTKRLARSSEMFCVGVLNERFRFPGVERAGAVCGGHVLILSFPGDANESHCGRRSRG